MAKKLLNQLLNGGIIIVYGQCWNNGDDIHFTDNEYLPSLEDDEEEPVLDILEKALLKKHGHLNGLNYAAVLKYTGLGSELKLTELISTEVAQ